MRLVGPNCMGVINTAPDVSLDATFAPDKPVRGRIGFLSQSGGLGIAVMARAQALGSGISSFVSVGNKADLSGNDFLQYWESDAETGLIMLYLESFGNPRKFARIARRVSRSKPILAVKGGRSPAGSRATSSHTGALLSASDVTVDALFQQAGVDPHRHAGRAVRRRACCWAASRCRPATAWPSSPTPAVRRSCAPTRARPSGLTVPRCRRRCARSWPPSCRLPPRPQPGRHAGGGDAARTTGASIGILGACPEVDALIVIFTPPLVTKALRGRACDPSSRRGAAAPDSGPERLHVQAERTAR